MDYDKLIEASLKILDLCINAATAIKTLKTENERLQEEAEHWKNVHHQAALNFQQENREHNKALADLARVTAERDAAIEDLLDAAITPCSYCKQNPNNGGACDMDNDNHEMFSCWEWRGIEED